MNVEGMTVEEIKKHLRKEYPYFSCPAKSDRIDIPEAVWQQIDWTDEEKFRNAALPHKMWNRRHDDHLWPMCHDWRGDNAHGPRAGEGHQKYFPEVPKLIMGRGIARWMMAGDKSIAEVPAFFDYNKEWTPDNIPEVVEFFERKDGNPDFGKLLRWSKKNFLRYYAPSSLQKFSPRSYLIREPEHKSWHYMIQKREEYTGNYEPDTVLFYRKGWRWDSWDGFYVKNAIYFGLRWN